MKRLIILVCLAATLSLLLTCGVFSRDGQATDSFSKEKIKGDFAKPSACPFENEFPRQERTRGGGTQVSAEIPVDRLYWMGGTIGYTDLSNSLGWLEDADERKQLKDLLGDMKEALLKMGMDASIAASLDELRDLVGAEKPNENAIDTKITAILDAIKKWIVKEEGQDKFDYFCLGWCSTRCAVLVDITISSKSGKEEKCGIITETFLSAFTELQKDLEGDDRLPGAAVKGLASVVSSMTELKDKPAAQEKNLKTIKRGLENIQASMKKDSAME